MKKIIYIFIISLLPLFLTGCTKYDNVSDFYNKMQLKKNAYNDMQFLLKVKLGEIKTQSMVYLSGENSRIESSLDGGKTYPTTSIKYDGVSYVYVPASSTAYQVSGSANVKLDALEWGEYDLSNFSFGKKKKYGGNSCLEVVSYAKDSKIYYCVSEKYGIPIVSKISLGKDYTMESSISKIKTSRISKKKFELPEGVKLIIQGR